MKYTSGPGRKWLIFLAGGGAWACLFAIGATHGATPLVQTGRAVLTGGFGGLAFWAYRTGVKVDGDVVLLRHWRRGRRLRFSDIADVELDPVAPHIVLRTGDRVQLLDNWHADPAAVAIEVRRRWLAAGQRRAAERDIGDGPF